MAARHGKKSLAQCPQNQMIELRDEERCQLARELHDGMGQDLSVAKMALDSIRKANHLPDAKQKAAVASELIDNAIRQVRSVSYLLHPPLLDEFGLTSALRTYVEGLGKRSNINASIMVEPSAFPRLVPGVEMAIFRVVQEALTNVFRHAEATTVQVTLLADANGIVVMVRDDGRGISEQTANFVAGCIGVGIGGMKQRINEFGGELSLRNANPGTVVEAVIPLKPGLIRADLTAPVRRTEPLVNRKTGKMRDRQMNKLEAGVLFVGEYPAPNSWVARALRSLRCEYQCAALCEEALSAMEERKFPVVLSKTKLGDGSGRRLIPATQMAAGWLFLSFPVERGSLWIPVVEEGNLSIRAVAMHSREFSDMLLKIVKAMMTGMPTGTTLVPRAVAAVR
jgi:two-component sensor histidine kinase